MSADAISNSLQLDTLLLDVCVLSIQEISADNASRLVDYKQDVQTLAAGIFISAEYFACLKEKKLTAALQDLKKTDASINFYLPEQFFDKIEFPDSPTGYLPGTFRLKKGMIPRDALRAARKGLSLLDCGTSCQIADYEAILSVLKEEKFNALFAGGSPKALVIGTKLRKNPIKCLRKLVAKTFANLKKGDLCYISNARTYGDKHPQGNSSGYYCICVDDIQEVQKFTALGLRSKGLTLSQIHTILIEDYNRPQDLSFEDTSESVQKILTEVFEPFREFASFTIDFERYEKEGGGKLTHVWEYNLERITALAQSSIEESINLLQTWTDQIQ